MALEAALHHPSRAATLALLNPAGFGHVTGRLLAGVLLASLAASIPRPSGTKETESPHWLNVFL
ncbi:hypothetical protein JD76_04434 [Micromonospora endolithica]|nr:hypothetical protein JD76_04434 [Micromonospora endolithica]